MEDFEYYGLFLTQESKDKLKYWLYAYNPNDIYRGIDWSTFREHLDHCTLLHKSQKNSIKEELENKLGDKVLIVIDGIGVSNKALAFRVNKYTFTVPCANNTPYITIGVFNGGRPVESNYITNWFDIKSMILETILEKR